MCELLTGFEPMELLIFSELWASGGKVWAARLTQSWRVKLADSQGAHHARTVALSEQ